MSPLRFVLPMPENIANGPHNHWRTRHGAKLVYYRRLDTIQLASGLGGDFTIPPPPRHPFPRASLSSVMYLGAAMDDSNAMRRHKWIEDWLKTRGYLVDDRKKCLTWLGFPAQIVSRKQVYRVELVLSPLSPV